MLSSFVQQLILVFQESAFLKKSGIAGVIIMTGLIVSHFVSRIIGIAVRKFGKAENIKKYGIKNPDTFFEEASNYIILSIAFILALNRIGILTTVLSIAGLIIISIVVILLVLKFRDMLANFWAGIVLHSMHRDIKPGIHIKTGDLFGEVKKFGWLETTIHTTKKETVVVPNRHLLECKVRVFRE